MTDSVRTDENAKLTDCYYDKKDWRLCKGEVRAVTYVTVSTCLEVMTNKTAWSQMERFRQCWKQQGNDKRTDMKDA